MGKSGENCVDVRKISQILKYFRTKGREFYQANYGFSAPGLQELKRIFNHYDLDGSGDIGNHEMIQLIEDTFPDMAHDKAMRPKLLQILKKADSDNSGYLNFKDFMRLMQLPRELKNEERVKKEQNAVKATMFKPHEVEDFREFF